MKKKGKKIIYANWNLQLTSKEREVIDFVNTMISEFQRDYGFDKAAKYGLTRSSLKATVIARIFEIGHINKEAWYSWFHKIMKDKPYKNLPLQTLQSTIWPDPRYEC